MRLAKGWRKQAVGVLMTMVNLAAYPLILRTLEHAGPDAAREQTPKECRPAARCRVACGDDIYFPCTQYWPSFF